MRNPDDIWSLGYDAEFTLNEFNQPKLTSEIELKKNVLIFVLFSRKGQYPSLPLIGMNIEEELYSHYDEIDVGNLQNEIINQCSALGVSFQTGEIQIKKQMYRNQPSLLIGVYGRESYPEGYMRDSINQGDSYLIGITYDDMKQMIYDVGIMGGDS